MPDRGFAARGPGRRRRLPVARCARLSAVARLVVVVLAVALALGCSGGDDDDGAVATTTTAPLHADQDLADGVHFGFVTALDPSRRRLVFDEAELLEGDEAQRAAAADGTVPTPGGKYVHNPEDRMNRVTMSADVVVRLVADECCELEEVPFEEWLRGFATSDRQFYGTGASHYRITIEDQRVVLVEEVVVG